MKSVDCFFFKDLLDAISLMQIFLQMGHYLNESSEIEQIQNRHRLVEAGALSSGLHYKFPDVSAPEVMTSLGEH